VQKPC